MRPNMTRGGYFEDEVDVHCTETDKTVRAVVMDFAPEEWLMVVVNKAIKINLQYHKQHDIYIGTSAGLEFQSNGPKRIA